MSNFKIDVEDLAWLNGQKDDVHDLCLHGNAVDRNGYTAFWNEWHRRRGEN